MPCQEGRTRYTLTEESALDRPVFYNKCILESWTASSWPSWVGTGVLALGIVGCATEMPTTADLTDTGATFAVGRVTTVLTGERKRIYEPTLRTFELENQQTHERFRVDVQSDDQQFALSLPPGKYVLNRIQISEGPFMSMAQLSASFTLEPETITYLGTWRFGVDSPRYGRMVALSMVVKEEDRIQAEQVIKEKYPSQEASVVMTVLPDPSESETRLYEVMPYPRYPRYFQRHYW